jgi:hypothetical protein
MKETTLKKANEIDAEIKRLKKEVNWLMTCYTSNGWFHRIIFGVKTAFLYNRSKFQTVQYFDLEKEDVEILQDRRILKIRELKEELENLQDNEEKGGEE